MSIRRECCLNLPEADSEKRMQADISILKTDDIDAVDKLMKRFSNTVGFLPKIVLKEHLERGWILGARNAQDQLVGYLLFARYPNRFRIAQLCVSTDYRNMGIARRLMEALKATATTQKIIKLTCRNDYPAHRMWPKLGFVPLEEKVGRSKEGHLLTIWRLILAPEDQLALFRADMSEDTIDAAIDAQIFFDFNEPNSVTNRPSKTLLADFLVDSVRLWYSDELLVEISRNHNREERQSERVRAGQFFQLSYDPVLFEINRKSLSKILPNQSPSQESDLNHLAKTTASDIRIFVTRDRALLRKAGQIQNAVRLTVLSPSELILRQRELSEAKSYMPDRVSGLGLEWRRFSSSDFRNFSLADFLVTGERLNKLRSRLEAFLVDPKSEVEVLFSDSEPAALRVISYEYDDSADSILGKIGKFPKQKFVGTVLNLRCHIQGHEQGLGNDQVRDFCSPHESYPGPFGDGIRGMPKWICENMLYLPPFPSRSFERDQ